MRSSAWLPSVLLLFALVLPLSSFAHPSNLAAKGLADGPGIWINIWNYPDGDLDAYCAKLNLHGIVNLFIQTSRSNTDAIKHPERLGLLIEACHRQKIRVIAWSFAELLNPEEDAQKLVAAAEFRSLAGEQIDGIACNLEKNLEVWRVEVYSKYLRNHLGTNYPLVAVVYSPLNRAPETARTPWTLLGSYFNIIAPMSYWNSKYQKLDAYEYTVKTIHKVRELTGKPDLEVHVIGDGMGTSSSSILDFLRACYTAQATSASLYPNHKITDEQLGCLSKYRSYFEPNSRFRLAAFRETLKFGALPCPPHNDPSQPINRDEFYCLVVKQFKLCPKTDVAALDAAKTLVSLGLVPNTNTTAIKLSAPIAPYEALMLLAAVIEPKQAQLPTKGKTALATKRSFNHWFTQPVMAETTYYRHPDKQFVNFLDAAQMVLEASSALR